MTPTPEAVEAIAQTTWERVEGEGSWRQAGVGDKFNHRQFTRFTLEALQSAAPVPPVVPDGWWVDGYVVTLWNEDDTEFVNGSRPTPEEALSAACAKASGEGQE